MSIPDKRIVLVSLLGGFIGIAAALLLLYATPQFQLILLAILFIVGGEASFMVWGISKINHKERKSLRLLFYTGISTLIFAVLLLSFRQYLEMYTLKITALGLTLGVSIQCYITNKLYKAYKKPFPLILLIITVTLLPATIPFVVYSPFLFQTSSRVLAILCFLYAADVFSGVLYLQHKNKK
ncbi:MAG: hypothetical protein PHR05_03775 [Bacteroidales bacterium]|nr:hypothetical protein [Bacteroidales bacterium]